MDEFRKKRKLELKNIFVKKYKITNEISARSFNEKKNEIYDQHYDYSYTKNTIIDFVNDDCLAAIFMYVPACERPKIALVCQKWKRALEYSWSNVKKLELTHWKCDENPSCLMKYPTLDGQLSFLKSLLYKCGRYLTQLDLTAYEHCNIVPIINEYCPNLVKLRFRLIHVDDVILYNAFSRLSKLKVLAILFQDFNDDFIPLTLINSLRNVADTLTDLTLSNWRGEKYLNHPCNFSKETIGVIRELKVLKRVDVGGIKLPDDLHDYLYDEMSVYAVHDYYFHIYDIAAKTDKFKNIESLYLGQFTITDDGLYTLANNLKQLKLLHIEWNHVTNFGIVTISKMNLLAFAFSGSNNVIDSSSIKLLKNLMVIIFPNNNIITDDLATKLLENSPQMILLYVMSERVTVELIKKAAEISRNRKQKLNLGVSFMCDKKQYETPYLTITLEKD